MHGVSRYNEHSATVFRPNYRDFELTTNRHIIQVSDGCAELICPSNATGIHGQFDNGLPRKVRHIKCKKNGQTWLYFTNFGTTCKQ